MGWTLWVITGVLVAFFVLTNIAPGVLILLTFVAFPVGIALFFLNTVTLYFLAALPAFIVMRAWPRPWPKLALALSLIPAVAVVPPLLTQAIATWKMQWQYRTQDVDARLPATPKSVELIGDPSIYGSDDPLKNAPCDALCQRLLLSRRVDVVRVTRLPAAGSGPARQLDYVIEPRTSCPNAFGDNEPMLPQTKDAIVSGTCFVARPPDGAAMAARIAIRKIESPEPPNLIEDLAAATGAVREILTLDIAIPEAGGWSVKLHQTAVKFSHWALPLYLTFAPCRGMCLGRPVFGRTERTLNPFDPDAVALKALRAEDGAPPQDRLSPAARVMALLDRAGDGLTSNQMQLVTDWAASLPCTTRGCPPVAGLDEAVMMRLVKDRRVTELAAISHIVARNRHLIAANLDLFLDEMAARGANSQYANAVGAAMAQLDGDVLRGRGERILALIRDNAWTWSRGIGIASGRLGLDTTGLIVERLGRPAQAATAALAACMADEPIGRALVPDLLAYLRALPVSDQHADNATRDTVKALARFGHFEEAKEIYVSRFPKSGEQTVPRHAADAVVKDVSACFFG